MAQIRCPSGTHVYDSSKHKTCPFCKPSQQKGKTSATTVIVGSDSSSMSTSSPAVAWLVIVKGKGQGQDLRVSSGMNKIGREAGDITLPFGDKTISREKHAFLAYDPDENFFLIQHGEGRNPLKVNGKMVMTSQGLSPFDRIKLGKTELLFVPLCNEVFNWRDGYTAPSPIPPSPAASPKEETNKRDHQEEIDDNPKSSNDTGLYFE